MPATSTKGGVTLLSRIGSIKKWGVRRRRGTSSTSSEVIGGFFFIPLISFNPFYNLSFHLATEPQSQDAPDHTARPKNSMSSFTRELSTSSSYPSTLNGTSSAADTHHTHTHCFFRASSGTGNPGASSKFFCVSRIKRDNIGHNKQRKSTSQSRDSEGTNQQFLLPSIEPQPPSPPQTIAQVAVESSTTWPRQKARLRSWRVKGGENQTRSLASAVIGVRPCICYRLEHTLPRFRWYPRCPYHFLHWSLQERRSLRRRLRCFLTPTGSPFLPASPNKLMVGDLKIPTMISQEQLGPTKGFRYG